MSIFQKNDTVTVIFVRENKRDGWLFLPNDWAIGHTWESKKYTLLVAHCDEENCLLLPLGASCGLEDLVQHTLDEETAKTYSVPDEHVGKPYAWVGVQYIERAKEGCWCRGPYCPNGYNIYALADRSDGTYLCRACKEHLRSLGKSDV